MKEDEGLKDRKRVRDEAGLEGEGGRWRGSHMVHNSVSPLWFCIDRSYTGISLQQKAGPVFLFQSPFSPVECSFRGDTLKMHRFFFYMTTSSFHDHMVMEIRCEGRARWKDRTQHRELLWSFDNKLENSVCNILHAPNFCEMLLLDACAYFLLYFLSYVCSSSLCFHVLSLVILFSQRLVSSSVRVNKPIVLEGRFGRASPTPLFLSSALLARQMTAEYRASTHMFMYSRHTVSPQTQYSIDSWSQFELHL